MGSSEVSHFGEFTLDVAERRLTRGGTLVHLSPKAHDVLALLVRQAGHLVTKNELLACVWPEVFVEEGILTVHVSSLRKALGDQRRPPSYVETVPRCGYRFIAAVTHEAPDGRSPLFEPHRSVTLYDLVGRGRVHLLSGSHVELPRAVEAFRAAIALDPTYAPAHAGLARARCVQAVLRAVPHQKAFAEAKESALRALAMDSGSADAQVALGTVHFLAEWDWVRAERSLHRALDVNPDHTEALLQYGSLHDAVGQLDEGLRIKQRALARDPHSPLVLMHIALSYSHQRRYDQALTWAHRALEVEPTHFLGAVFIAFIYWRLADIDGFIAQNIRAATARGISDEALASLKQVSAQMRQVHAAKGFAGWCEFMAEQISTDRRNAAEPLSTASQCAMLYGAAGRCDQAFACLDEAIASRDPAMVYLAVGPQWEPLRRDPRFAHRLHAVWQEPVDPLFTPPPWSAEAGTGEASGPNRGGKARLPAT